MYKNESIKKYLGELASGMPTPGGGSAAALSAALGTSLLQMACGFTIGNERYRLFEEEVGKENKTLMDMRGKFTELIDEDVKVYKEIRSAFKSKDEKNIDKALRQGYDVSLRICGLSKNAMQAALNLSGKTNANLITDIGCGAELLLAACNSGMLNAYSNLSNIKDGSFAAGQKAVLEQLNTEIRDLYKNVTEKVKTKMRRL